MSINILLVEGTKHGEINHCEVVKIFNAHLISMLLCFATTSTVIIACCPCKQETPASRAARRKNWSVLGTLPTSGTRPMKQLRSTNFSISLRLHTHTQITKAINQWEKFGMARTKSLCSLGMLFFQVLYFQNMKHGCPFGFLGLEFAPLHCVLP